MTRRRPASQRSLLPVDAQLGGGDPGAAGGVHHEHGGGVGDEDPQPPPVAVLIRDVFEHLPAGLIGVHVPGGPAAGSAIACAHGAISGATCFSAPHKVPAATPSPSAASALTIRCTGPPSTCFSYASRARNPTVNSPFGTGFACSGAQTVPGPG